MNIAEKFLRLKSNNEMALIAYITCGYPSLSDSFNIIQKLINNGVDIIELGVPFSDPIADGPTIQYSTQVALEKGIVLDEIFASASELTGGVPLVLMSYLNPILAYSKEKIFRNMNDAGISGLIIPDLPVEESLRLISNDEMQNISLIPMVAPTSTDERIKFISEHARGFIYCVSSLGTTGMRTRLPDDLCDLVSKVKSCTPIPVAVGFGISQPEQINQLIGHADGVVIGSRFIEAIRNKEDIDVLAKAFKKVTRR